ncbi:hypothetical protein CONCODRAFT_169407 [Conidiobolus coronatus NRRL 28638]|uniref:Uncharacterized protein n=1 Tax=Conidiobolus coronatus (strain ATCC 28846 / CBS 209.66 / NRRL 28638) TaxID=796925 RepID=A0A137NRS8_CONC2|nr:hypothetical protein CONCODRAFT_169407 [Conidiobolus coronatus NRRL 28638]|eukprot:KXN65451.1 hypothetical protein CONCODRAFT_169407 [Conidiobolus coronatus NRRL 28638]
MDDRENEVVSLLDYYDNLYYGAQINTCFKLPKKDIDSIVVGGKNILQVFTSDKCEGEALYDIQGTFSANGNNDNWLSGKVVEPYNRNPAPSGRRYLRAAFGHHRGRTSSSRRHLRASGGYHRKYRGRNHHNYRIYRD